MTIKNLDYPGAPHLYEGPKGKKLQKHIMMFKSKDIDDLTVVDFKGALPNYKAFATEHIVEVRVE